MQIHYLNQDVAFGKKAGGYIAYKDGMTVILEGYASRDTEKSHYRAHEAMEINLETLRG